MSISFHSSFSSQKASSHLIFVLSFSFSLWSSVALQTAGSEAEVKGRVTAHDIRAWGRGWETAFFSLVEGGSSRGEKAVAAAEPKATAKLKVMVGVKRKAAKKPKLKPATKVVKTSAKAMPGKKAVEKVAAAKLKKTLAKKPKSVKTRMKKAKK
ncbi:hypothetical protein NL676_015704 [Syzygium grande]|nr:hypothetical protein NL676_015704 [Syzygium grande]